MYWIEVSLDLQPDLAEPASELLCRLAPNGVAIEMLGEEVRVRAWLPDDDKLAVRRQRLDDGLGHLSQIQPFPEPSFNRIESEDWEEAWKQQYQPLEVGERLLILPSWLQPEVGNPTDTALQGRIPIYLEPGMAFGTGAHTTTRHCLELMEEVMQPGEVVVDLGCGSGILAISCARLGAGKVTALDIDKQAVELAQDNALRNGVGDRVRVVLGSLPEVDQSDVGLILANIQATALKTLLETCLVDILVREGIAVLSGILEEQLKRVVVAAERNGFALEQVRSTGDWRTLVLRKV